MQIKFSKLYILTIIITMTIVGCGDMNSIHEQYLNGEQIYAGKLDSLKTQSGFERLKIIGNTQYLGNSKEVTVSWDDQTRTFPISKVVDNKFEIIIDNLIERNYEFNLITTDANANESIMQTIRGRAFGDVFIEAQSARRVTDFESTTDGDFIIWADRAESEYVVSTKLRYETNTGTYTEATVTPEDEKTEVIDWKPEGRLEIVSTVISGENGFDTVDLELVERTFPKLNIDWTLTATIKVSNENGGGVNSGEGSPKVIDNDTNTKYLYNYAPNSWMQQDFPVPGVVNFYTLTSGNDAPDRDLKSWVLAGSNNGTTWTTLDTKTNQSFSNRNETKEYRFTSTTAYNHYRMTITANNGSNLLQVSEWRLLRVD